MLFGIFRSQCVFAGKIYSTLIINFDKLNGDGVAYVYNVFYLFYALFVELGDVNEAFFTGCVFYEATEGHDTGYFTGEYRAYLGILGNGIDRYYNTALEYCRKKKQNT